MSVELSSALLRQKSFDKLNKVEWQKLVRCGCGLKVCPHLHNFYRSLSIDMFDLIEWQKSNDISRTICVSTLKVRPHGQKLSRTTWYYMVVRHRTCHGHAKSCCATNVHTSTISFTNLAQLQLVSKLQGTSFLVFIQYVWWRRRFCSFSCYNCDFECCDCRPPCKKTPSSLLVGKEKIQRHRFYQRPHTWRCGFIIVRI